MDDLSPHTSLPSVWVNLLGRLEGQELYDAVNSFVLAGWPLRVIAEALGVSKMTASRWSKQAKNTVSVPKYHKKAAARRKKTKKYEMDEQMSQRLLDLYENSRGIHRGTPEDDPKRLAKAELCDLLVNLSGINYQVSISDLARTIGVSRKTIYNLIDEA